MITFVTMNLQNGRYTVGGVDLLELADKYGTPLYVYDSETIEAQYHRMYNSFHGVKLKIKFACKALSNQAILKLFKKLGAGLDAVSIEEVELGLLAGFPSSEILFTPNCVSFEEIKHGVEKKVTINIDNISILEQFGNTYGNSVPCCIRLNPHITAGGNQHIQTGHVDSKFGISVHQIRHIERIIKTCNMRVTGLHIHTGSEILDASVFIRVAELLFESAQQFPDLEFIDFGSGFKVAYHEGDNTTNIEELGVELSARFSAFCKQIGKELELWFEPGKFLVSEAGILLVRANVVKQTLATVFVGVNSGQNHLIRPMFYDAYHRIMNISDPSGKERIYTIVGYICETDTFGWDRKLPEVRENDVLAILNAGAYGYTMSNNYNARLRPAEVLVHQGKDLLIRRREVLDDLLRTQIDVNI